MALGPGNSRLLDANLEWAIKMGLMTREHAERVDQYAAAQADRVASGELTLEQAQAEAAAQALSDVERGVPKA